MSKEFLDRVKANQAAKAEASPLPMVTVKVEVMSDNTVRVSRPEGNSPQQLAAVINLLATAQQIICEKLAKAEPGRIVMPPPGTRVQ